MSNLNESSLFTSTDWRQIEYTLESHQFTPEPIDDASVGEGDDYGSSTDENPDLRPPSTSTLDLSLLSDETLDEFFFYLNSHPEITAPNGYPDWSAEVAVQTYIRDLHKAEGVNGRHFTPQGSVGHGPAYQPWIKRMVAEELKKKGTTPILFWKELL
jgi:hypothetical protein